MGSDVQEIYLWKPVKDKGGGGRRQEDHDAGLTPMKGEREREPHAAGWVWGTSSQTNGEVPGKAATGRNSVASGSRALPASVIVWESLSGERAGDRGRPWCVLDRSCSGCSCAICSCSGFS